MADPTVPTWAELRGICAPATPPTDAERCVCCTLDARDEEGGEEHNGQRWCFICVGRGLHEED